MMAARPRRAPVSRRSAPGRGASSPRARGCRPGAAACRSLRSGSTRGGSGGRRRSRAPRAPPPRCTRCRRPFSRNAGTASSGAPPMHPRVWADGVRRGDLRAAAAPAAARAATARRRSRRRARRPAPPARARRAPAQSAPCREAPASSRSKVCIPSLHWHRLQRALQRDAAAREMSSATYTVFPHAAHLSPPPPRCDGAVPPTASAPAARRARPAPRRRRRRRHLHHLADEAVAADLGVDGRLIARRAARARRRRRLELRRRVPLRDARPRRDDERHRALLSALMRCVSAKSRMKTQFSRLMIVSEMKSQHRSWRRGTSRTAVGMPRLLCRCAVLSLRSAAASRSSPAASQAIFTSHTTSRVLHSIAVKDLQCERAKFSHGRPPLRLDAL